MIRTLLLSLLVPIILSVFSGCNPSESTFLSTNSTQCKGCVRCVNVCKADAIRMISNKAVIDLSKCTKCGNCIEICLENAIY